MGSLLFKTETDDEFYWKYCVYYIIIYMCKEETDSEWTTLSLFNSIPDTGGCKQKLENYLEISDNNEIMNSKFHYQIIHRRHSDRIIDIKSKTIHLLNDGSLEPNTSLSQYDKSVYISEDEEKDFHSKKEWIDQEIHDIRIGLFQSRIDKYAMPVFISSLIWAFIVVFYGGHYLFIPILKFVVGRF